MHRTTTHNDAKFHAQGAPRSQTSSTHTSAAVDAQTRTDDTENEPVVDLMATSTGASHFKLVKNTTGCSNSADMRSMDMLPTATLGCELGTATRSVKKIV